MACFHCGEPAAPGARFCCAGCEAVSGAIFAGGLGDYYRLRESVPPKPEAVADNAHVFDDPRIQAGFVRVVDENLREAELVVEGMRCAACAWLVEQSLSRLEGVEHARVIFADRRAFVRWRPGALRVSAILERVRAVGYRAWPYDEKRLAQVEARERRASLARLWVAGLAMMQVMMYALPAYLGAEDEVTRDIESLMRWAGFVLTLPVIFYCALPFHRGAWRDLAARRLGVDVPVSLGLIVAFAASTWATFTGEGAVYFDSVAMFVFLLAGGRHLEMLARARAAGSLSHLARLAPQMAARLRSRDGLDVESIPAAMLARGDRVLVRAGEALPADGELESASAELAEALVSGESRPVTRRTGEQVLAGTINAGSALVFRVTQSGGDTTLASIARLMQRALGERPRWVEAAEKASPIFVALVLAASLVAFAVWSAIDPSRALWIAVSVLIVTCPCALSLATPVALTVATGELARLKLVVARGRAIEALAGAGEFVFDKTGTLTRGEPVLVEVIPLAMNRVASVALAAAIARVSTHPLDRALAKAGEGLAVPSLEDHLSVPGQGIEARIDGRRYRLGRAGFAGPRQTGEIRANPGDTLVWLGNDECVLAAFRLADAIRPEARGALDALRRSGARVHLLTGDEPLAASAVAEALGIDSVEARASPGRKLAFVRERQGSGARVAMVGDGINDAPTLAQADLSVAMGSGADLAQVRADAVLLSNSLSDLVRARELALRARRVIRQNIAWALAYNAVAIPLAFAGAVTPLVAGIGMSASSLAVVLNALRLRS